MEFWKQIEGYPDYYISDHGRVKSVKFNKERIIKGSCTSRGYRSVTLSNNGINRLFSVHRLVGIYFVDGYKSTLVINHKNKDISDNNACNLEWVTQYENVMHGKELEYGRFKVVKHIRLDSELAKKIIIVAKDNEITQTSIIEYALKAYFDGLIIQAKKK